MATNFSRLLKSIIFGISLVFIANIVMGLVWDHNVDKLIIEEQQRVKSENPWLSSTEIEKKLSYEDRKLKYINDYGAFTASSLKAYSIESIFLGVPLGLIVFGVIGVFYRRITHNK